MKLRPYSIAIYSGVVPSTTFIERLINGLSKEHEIYLFGIKNGPLSHKAGIHYVTYKNNQFSKLLHYLKFWLLLSLFKRKQLKTLDALLKSKTKFSWNNRLRAYPVLWHQPSIFHIQWVKGIDDWIWVQQFGIKLVASLRGAHINYSPIASEKLANTYRQHFTRIDGFHAVSEAIAQKALNYGAQNNQMKVVYSGLDLEAKPHIIKHPSKIVQIISVGRSHWIKGYHYAFDACKLLIEDSFNFHYTIIGAADSIELLYQIKDLQLENVVTLLPSTSFEEVLDYIQQSDLLWLPSVEEGLANVVMEAMQVGTMVLSSDCGGMNELIEDGVNGFLVPLRDPMQLAQKTQEICALPEDVKAQVISRASLTLRQKHTAQQMVKGMVELYQSALEN